MSENQSSLNERNIFLLDYFCANTGGIMKLCYQEIEVLYRSLPHSAQWILALLSAAVLYISGGVIGSSLGKAIYFLTN
jgi:hypothetical protein